MVVLSVLSLIGVQGQECFLSHYDENLAVAAQNLLTTHRTLSKNGSQKDTVEFTTKQDYGAASSGNRYSTAKTECEKIGYHLCGVTTDFEIDAHLSTESGRPVCVPNSCPSDARVAGETLNCGGLQCTKKFQVVECPSGKLEPTVEAANCTSDLSSLIYNITKPIDRIFERMEEECHGTMYGHRNQWCSTYEVNDRNSDRQMTDYNLIRDFAPLTGGTYQTYQEKCEAAGNTLVNIDTRVGVDKYELRLFELSKPLCVSAACSEDGLKEVIDLLDPYPLMCEATDEDCRIVSRDIDIISNSSTLGTDTSGICGPLIDPELDELHDVLVRRADSQCLEALHGKNSGVCSIITKTTTTEPAADVGTEGQEFEDLCNKQGNAVVYFSGDVSLVDRRRRTHEETISEYEDYPLCLPKSCIDESDESLALFALTADCADCILDVDDLDRHPFPTLSPTKAPTKAPVVPEKEQVEEMSTPETPETPETAADLEPGVVGETPPAPTPVLPVTSSALNKLTLSSWAVIASIVGVAGLLFS